MTRYDRDGCLRIAASLSYTSLLGLVPLVAIAVAVLSAFPVFDVPRSELGALLLSYLAPHAGAQVQGHIDRFVANTGQLTTVGVVGLAVVAVMLLATVEAALNTIWRAPKQRPWVARLTAYWALLTLGPLLLAAGLSLSGTVLAGAELFGVSGGLGGARELAVRAAPFAFALLGFTALYAALPNRRVRLVHAAAGGLVAALLFEALKSAFGLFVAGIGSVQAVYGALAALPLFLMWMYFAWSVVLFGAVVAAAWPEWLVARRDTVAPPATPVTRLVRALQVLAVLQEAARSGDRPTAEDLLGPVDGDREALAQALAGLEDGGYVARLEGGGLLLARDLAMLTVYDLYCHFGVGSRRHDLPPLEGVAWGKRFAQLIDAAAARDSDLLALPLAALFGAPPSGGGDRAVVPPSEPGVVSFDKRGRLQGGT